jgi:hypothetical protein
LENLCAETPDANPVGWILGSDGLDLLAEVCFGLPNLMPKCVETAAKTG